MRPIGRTTLTLTAVVALAACDGAERSSAPEIIVPVSKPAVASLRASVDLVAGTMTFEPVAPRPGSLGAASAVSPAIYGNQGVTVRIYNSAVAVTSGPTPGKKRFTANVGVRNLQPFPIGDEQGGPVPDDTTGIFVFVNGGPTVTATSTPCAPACTITVANAHGRAAFNAPGQPYWYWADRLTAAGGLRDTTLVRQAWSFEADSQVTRFSFDVLVAADWPAPYQTRWRREYTADALPHTTSTPRWMRTTDLGTETVALADSPAGSVILIAPANGSQRFIRRDSLGPATDAYIEARLRVNGSLSRAEISFGFYDGTRYIGVGLTSTRVGFMENGFSSPNISSPSTTTNFQTYRLRKFGADSVQLLVNGTVVHSRAYSSFSTTYPGSSFVDFGNPGSVNHGRSQSGNSSTWDYVTYEIGATQP